METIVQFTGHLWRLSLEAAPWLVVGLVMAGLMKAWLSLGLLGRWLGGRGWRPIARAALVGTPLPLCSCSVVPAAVELRRGGASRGATVSFLIATPENGADSIALSYALLGPFMTVARPIAAIVSAMLAGWLTDVSESRTAQARPGVDEQTTVSAENCCTKGGCGVASTRPPESSSFFRKTAQGLGYAMGDLYRDIVGWLALGLVLAAAMNTLLPPEALARWGSGVVAMLVMLLAGVPMYICATASTPVAAALLAAGVSPGAVLVFLLAGPATNAGTVGIVWRQLGRRAAVTYLLGIGIGAIVSGLGVDYLLGMTPWQVHGNGGVETEWMPMWVGVLSVAVLLGGAARLIWRGQQGSRASTSSTALPHEPGY